MFWSEGGKRDLYHLPTGNLDRLEPLPQRMGGRDLVGAIGPDQHEMLQIRPRQQILQHIERRRVEPLQVVEEERQRMVRSREHADEPTEYQLETSSRVLGSEIRNRRLVSDDELEVRDEVDHEPPIRAQRLDQSVAPTTQLGVALPEKIPNEALKGLGERGVGDVALVLIELAGGEQSARWHEHFVQLVDHR